MQISSGALVLLAFLFFGGDIDPASPDSQAADLEKAVSDLEKTQELLRTRQTEARQILQQVRQRQTTLDALLRRLDLALKRAHVILDVPPPGRRPTPQPSKQPVIDYKNFKTFEIPFERHGNRTFRQIFLLASVEGQPYKRVASATAGDNHFLYTAEHDGWHSFFVQVEELDGSLTPRDLNAVAPALRVCVDTVKPVARLRPVAPRHGSTVGVEWEVRDNNLDLHTLSLQYAPQKSDRWVTLGIRQLAFAQYSWSPEGSGPFDVRLQVSDLAGNITTATTTINPGAVLPEGTGVSAKQTPGQPVRVIHVKSKTFKLNYKTDAGSVGESGVKCVEVWQTRNTRQWQKVKADAPADGPCEIKVEAPGRYGFTLRPVNGVGRGPRPPAPRQPPQIWVEVDEKAPEVVLHSVVVGEGADQGFITINWKASDSWLRERPITIKYAKPGPGGAPAAESWVDLQTNVENTGTCRCAVPKDLFEFDVRVEAIDQAGNVGTAETKESVKVDSKLPLIKDDDVKIETGPDAPVPPPGS